MDLGPLSMYLGLEFNFWFMRMEKDRLGGEDPPFVPTGSPTEINHSKHWWKLHSKLMLNKSYNTRQKLNK